MIEQAKAFKDLLAEHFVIDDWQAIDLLLAMVLCHKVPHTEMLWLRLIGASGTGKTELLRCIGELQFAEKAEHLTPAALRGGYVPRGNSRKNLGPMLLERIDQKLVVTKEFASILTSRKEDRNQVLGILRSVYDGEFVSDFGGEQRHLVQKTKFDWIIGTTAYVDQQRNLETQLGSRFIDLRWRTPENGKALSIKAMQNDPILGTIRRKMVTTLRYLADIVDTKNIKPVNLAEIPDIAVFAARYRTPVQRDTKTREIMEVPDIESPARLSQALARIVTGLSILGIENTKPYIVRLALDTLPKTRATYVQAIRDGVTGRDELARVCRVSNGAMTYTRDEMKMLGFDESEPLDFLKE